MDPSAFFDMPIPMSDSGTGSDLEVLGALGGMGGGIPSMSASSSASTGDQTTGDKTIVSTFGTMGNYSNGIDSKWLIGGAVILGLGAIYFLKGK